MDEPEEKLNAAFKLLARKDINLVRIKIDSNGSHRFYLSDKAYNLKNKFFQSESFPSYQYVFEKENMPLTKENLTLLYVTFTVMHIIEQTGIKDYLEKHHIKNVNEESIFWALVSLFLADAKGAGLID